MTERIIFSVTLLRDDALPLQEAANEGGLLLSEYAARCLASIAEDDRRAHAESCNPLYAVDETGKVIGIDRSPSPFWKNHAAEDTGVPGHPPLRLIPGDGCNCRLCRNDFI
jgi:hypothetical protein